MKKYKNILSISICIIYLLSICIYFWTQSRYPQLDEKAVSGMITHIPDFLSFDLIVEHEQGESKVQEIYISLINWLYTNWRGMVFGLAFGIGLLTLIHFISLNKVTKNRFILAFIGVLNGFGLGVCANCSTPIGKSLLSGGISPITAINTIISSPTFNVVGLGMLFSIFPWYIACIKLLFYIVIVFIVVPNLFYKESIVKNKRNECQTNKNIKIQNNGKEIYYLGKIFLKNTYFIVSRTVPLMILGGVLGVTIMSFIPVDLINNLQVNTINLIIVSIISFLLPVPMLFDIIFSGAVYNSSIPSIFSFILLLNLGGFSVYTLFVLLQDIRGKKLLLFSFIFLTLSLVFSLSASNIKNSLDTKYDISTLTLDDYRSASRNFTLIEDINSLSQEDLNILVQGIESEDINNNYFEDIEIFQDGEFNDFSISSFDFKANKVNNGFEVIQGKNLGIKDPGYKFSLMINGIGISDYNNDNWKDIILPTGNGLKIYKNIGGSFEIDSSIELGDIFSKEEITQANFYDLDGDGNKDLLIASRNHGIHILWNDNGRISYKNSSNFEIPGNEMHTSSISLGDIFNNENIDIFIGRGAGIGKGEKFRNLVVKNLGNRKLEAIWLQNDIMGATFTSLIWDFNGDGINEVYEGNGVQTAGDLIYTLNTESKSLEIYKDMAELLPVTTFENMGITIGDINNDLTPEFFISGKENTLQKAQEDSILSSCQYPKALEQDSSFKKNILFCQIKELIISSSMRKECNNIQNNYIKGLCVNIENIIFSSSFDDNGERDIFCESLKGSLHFSSFYEFCTNKNIFELTQAEQKNYIPQVDNNVFLQENSDGIKKNIIHDFQSLDTGWSWGAFFGDLDNNGYQDLYVSNGHIRSKRPAESNKIMMNFNGTLSPEQSILGGENFLDTLTSSYIDLDNDGDLDIINTSIFGELIFFKNNLNTQNSISVQVTDNTTNNTESIGAKIIVGLPDGSEQVRFSYIGGHFLTLQDTEAHFGIKHFSEIEYIKIIWPDGQLSEINQELPANKKYIIHKNK